MTAVTALGRDLRPAWAILALSALACASGQPGAQAPDAQGSGTLGSGSEGSETSGSAEADPEQAVEEASSNSAADTESEEPRSVNGEAAEPAAVPEPVQRQITYRVAPEGLEIDIVGVRFVPKAEAVKLKNGGYSIRVTVKAKATDSESHALLSPENGPLAFSAIIYNKDGSETARHADHRSGDEQEFILPGGELEFTREWPSGSVKGPLWWGQKVKLQVGLWGLAGPEGEARPVRKLFVVEMMGGAKPRAIITPPEV